MPAKTPAKRIRRFSQAEIDTGLTVLAASGSSFEASEITGISASTLRQWKVDHADRYQEIREREAPKLEARAASQARELIIRAGETEHTILDLLNERLKNEAPTKELSEIAGTLQRVTTSKGINGTKLLELTGRPTSIVEHREGTDILRSLGAKIPGLVIESTAEELRQTRALPSESDNANARETGSQQRAD